MAKASRDEERTVVADEVGEQAFDPSANSPPEDALHDTTILDSPITEYASHPQMIHILGLGSLGKLVAHSLRGLPSPPPVTLVFPTWRLGSEWQESKQKIRLTTEGVEVDHTGYEWEVSIPPPRSHGQPVDATQKLNEYMAPGSYGRNVEAQKSSQATREVAELRRLQEEAEKRDVEPINMIHHLIVTVKAYQTVSALSAVVHRLTRNSTILFVQNGMGVIEEVNEKIFPDPSRRPRYMLGVTTHGVLATSTWCATHHGLGTLTVGILNPEPSRSSPKPSSTSGDDTAATNSEPTDPASTALKENDDKPTFHPHTHNLPEIDSVGGNLWSPSARYLLRTVLRSPALCAVGVPPAELLKVQIEKLAVNCVINPLTVMLDCRNGSLLYNYYASRTMRLILSEVSLVIRSLPELEGVPGVDWRLAPERLETIVVSVLDSTRHNISSMLADVRSGKNTEVQYINGYVVKRGEEMGVACVVNYSLMQMVRAKCSMISRELRLDLPVVDPSYIQVSEERREEDMDGGGVSDFI